VQIVIKTKRDVDEHLDRSRPAWVSAIDDLPGIAASITAADRARSRRRDVVARLAQNEVGPESDTIARIESSLKVLEERCGRAGRAFELYYFGGYSTKIIATKLAATEDSIRRELRFARAFIARELTERK
jgi:DNA-directed RNA polymerase specialized sigma24 family protein